jgi:hypothetical protein
MRATLSRSLALGSALAALGVGSAGAALEVSRERAGANEPIIVEISGESNAACDRAVAIQRRSRTTKSESR